MLSAMRGQKDFFFSQIKEGLCGNGVRAAFCCCLFKDLKMREKFEKKLEFLYKENSNIQLHWQCEEELKEKIQKAVDHKMPFEIQADFQRKGSKD